MSTTWQKALDFDQLPEGRVTTVTLGTHTLCMTHHEGNTAHSIINVRTKAAAWRRLD